MPTDRISFWDIPFDPIRPEEVGWRVQALLRDGRQLVVTTPNPEILLESLQNPELKSFLQRSDLSIADGVGILWATTYTAISNQRSVISKQKTKNKKQKDETAPLRPRGTVQAERSILSLESQQGLKKASDKSLSRTGSGRGRGDLKIIIFLATLIWIVSAPRKIRCVLPERVTGVDSMLDICAVAAQGGKSVFLLGGGEGVAEKTANVLRDRLPKLRIAGTYGGKPFTANDATMRRMIGASQADILFVAFGCPKQERWIAENLSKLPGVNIAMGVGGSFDFISGTINRAPRWMKTMGIEWLYRFVQEPRKRLPRIWRAAAVFPLQVWRNGRMKIF